MGCKFYKRRHRWYAGLFLLMAGNLWCVLFVSKNYVSSCSYLNLNFMVYSYCRTCLKRRLVWILGVEYLNIVLQCGSNFGNCQRLFLFSSACRFCSVLPSNSAAYTGCFTTLGHNCRRWFRRSLWSKMFILICVRFWAVKELWPF